MLIDTSGLYCFFDKKDVRHEEAKTFINSADGLLTHSYVLAEFIPLSETRGLDRTKVLEFTGALFDNQLVEIIGLTNHFTEKPMSSC